MGSLPTDAGTKVILIDQGLPAGGVTALAIDPRQPERAWLLVALGVGLLAVVAWGAAVRPTKTVPSATRLSLSPLDPGQVARGRQVYLQNCAVCHGANAQGAANWQKPDARGNLPPSPHDDHGHTWRHGDRELAEIIRNGLRDVFNKTPELTMPPFKDRLSDEEIAAVIAYFKSLWSPEHRRYQEEQTQRPVMATPGSGQ